MTIRRVGSGDTEVPLELSIFDALTLGRIAVARHHGVRVCPAKDEPNPTTPRATRQEVA